MTRYTVTHILAPTEDGKSHTLETTYDTFEEVANSIIKDLTSIWKGMIPLPASFRIDVAKEESLGIRIKVDGVVVSENSDVSKYDEVVDAYGQTMQTYWKNKIKTVRGD